jgi:hypothetical protein
VEVVREQADGGYVRVGYLEVGGVDAMVAFGVYAKAGRGAVAAMRNWRRVGPERLGTGRSIVALGSKRAAAVYRM